MTDNTQWAVRHVNVANPLGYHLVACVEAKSTFYVIMTGPTPRRENHAPSSLRVQVITDADEELVWRGQGGTVDKYDDLVVAKFGAPPPSVKTMTVTVTLDDAAELAAEVAAQ